jgi:type II secretory pathway pseudopilin PulG
MAPLLKKKLNNRGWTIVELMMVVAMIGLIVPALTSLFIYSYQGMAAAEMHLSLKALNENIMLHMHERMNSVKHMFQNNTASGGLSFIGQIQMGSAPASVSFSQMPIVQNGTTITFSPNAGAVSTSFGDCLFYAAYDVPQTINGVAYTAPITVTGVTDNAGNSVTVNLDVYRFYFDYLSSAGDLKPIAGMTTYWLIEWQSIQFVDAFELEDMNSTDATLEKNVMSWLANGANFPNGLPMTLAWDPSQSSMVDAFYGLTAGTTINPANYLPTSRAISMQSWTPLTRTNTGLVSNFNYGISGNYMNLAGDPPPPNVPQFCPPTTTANAFPGGFEVGLEGANAGMQVMIRSLLLAKGNYKNLIWDNQIAVNSCRDVW